jgi:hypothetical protein
MNALLQPGSVLAFARHYEDQPYPEDFEPVYVGVCVECNQPVDEEEETRTARGLMCERCAGSGYHEDNGDGR